SRCHRRGARRLPDGRSRGKRPRKGGRRVSDEQLNERFDADQEKARQLDERVAAELEAGESARARQALSRSWRELVPDLPLRFSVPLKRVDRDAVREVLRRWRVSGKRPPLRMVAAEDRIAIETQRGRKLRLGLLPRSE